MTLESFLEGHARAFEWLEGVAPSVSTTIRARSSRVVSATRSSGIGASCTCANYAFHAHACTPATPREKGSVEPAVRYLKTGFWPARRFGGPPATGASCAA